jgi:hypothetical protein
MRRLFSWAVLLLVLPAGLRAADDPAPGLDDLKKKLTEIETPAEKLEGEAAQRDAGLRRLRAYRFLAGLPYQDLVLDDDLNATSLAGAKLCEKLGRLEHTPKNPGMDEAEFKIAYRGTSSSNLAYGVRNLVQAVDGWMDDSDEGNSERLGHRRWCLNPPMKKLGFGRSGDYVAMFAFDRSRQPVPDFDVIAFPARGLMPVEYFRVEDPWSVSLNPRKYATPGKGVEPKVYAADEKGKKIGDPLKLTSSAVNTDGFGVPLCLIFRPEKVVVKPGKRYVVEIEGLKARGGKEMPLTYTVEFVSVK